MKVLNNNAKHQQGFTLIELVIVIVILGILAATAAPKFINLQVEARNAAMKAVEGAIESQVSLVHAKAIVGGLQSASASQVSLNSVNYAIAYGYPTAAEVTGGGADSGKGMGDLLKAEGFNSTEVSGDLVFYREDEPTPTTITTQCSVVYKTSTAAHARPAVNVVPCT